MARTKPFIRTRYFATGPITVNGRAYRAGDEILNARPCNIEAMLRHNQVDVKDWEEPKPGRETPAEQKAEPEPEPAKSIADTVPRPRAGMPEKPKAPSKSDEAKSKSKPKTKSLAEE